MTPHRKQRGAALPVSLSMLVLVLLLGVSAAQLAIQGEKAARNDRDRQLAFQAAEAALLDAELDIARSPDPARSRSALFAAGSTRGFPPVAGECGAGLASQYQGLCRAAAEGAVPAWQRIDFNADEAGAGSVRYGRFTGRPFHTGSGAAPVRPPRYIIELLRNRQPGERADRLGYCYRITAIGYGARDVTQVVLQAFYRKDAR